MQNLSIEQQLAQVSAAFDKSAKQAQYATMVAINQSLKWADTNVRREMRKVFDRPTPWVLKSLRMLYATDKRNPVASLGFKDGAWSSSAGEIGGRTMIEPHVNSGHRTYKGMEVRLARMGLLPNGWSAVPGGGAQLDGYGNMNRGQITQLLNVLGTYTESGYNKANADTRKRLAKDNTKRGVYGFVYWVNRVGASKGQHLQPGVYQRINTGFGSSLKPILIFVKRASYKQRLDFYGIAQTTVDQRFLPEFRVAFDEAMRTAFPTQQGSQQ